MLIAIAIAAGIIGLIILWRSPSGRLVLDRAILNSPFWRSRPPDRDGTPVAYAFGTDPKWRAPHGSLADQRTSVLANRALGTTVEVILRGVEQGRSLSSELQRSAAFPDLLPRLARIGEETGQLKSMLMKVAEAYERTVENRLERFMTLLTPVLTIIIGGFVGFLVVSVMNAILSANALVLQ